MDRGQGGRLPVEDGGLGGHGAGVEGHGALLHRRAEGVQVPLLQGLADPGGDRRSLLHPGLIEGRGLPGALHPFRRPDLLGPLGRLGDHDAQVPVVDRGDRLGGQGLLPRLAGGELDEAAIDRTGGRGAGLAGHRAEHPLGGAQLVGLVGGGGQGGEAAGAGGQARGGGEAVPGDDVGVLGPAGAAADVIQQRDHSAGLLGAGLPPIELHPVALQALVDPDLGLGDQPIQGHRDAGDRGEVQLHVGLAPVFGQGDIGARFGLCVPLTTHQWLLERPVCSARRLRRSA